MTPLRRSTTRLAIALAATLLFIGDRPARSDISPPAATPRDRDSGARDAAGSTVREVSATPRFRLRFTAPADAPAPPSGGADSRHARSVRRYEFLQVNQSGVTTIVRGYADSLGIRLLTPHRPGTRETVWLETTDTELAKTIFVLSRGWGGGTSARSNGFAIAAVVRAGTPGGAAAGH